jgi:hypothetical protein
LPETNLQSGSKNRGPIISPQANLVSALRGIFKFHQQATPIVSGLFAEPALLAAYRTALARQHKGPHLSLKALADYIAAEQQLGRIQRQVDATLAAYLLMSSSFFRAFSEQFFGGKMKPSWGRLAKRLVETVAPAPVKTSK